MVPINIGTSGIGIGISTDINRRATYSDNKYTKTNI